MLVKREDEKQQKIGEGQMNYPDYHGLEGLRSYTDAQMLPCQASTFTPDGVIITKQPDLKLGADRKLAETQGIMNIPLVDEAINKPSIITHDTGPAKMSMTWLEARALNNSIQCNLELRIELNYAY